MYFIKVQRYIQSKLSKMAASSHLVFDQTGNSAIRSANPENPTIKPIIKWTRWPIAEMTPFEILQMRGRTIVNTYSHWCHILLFAMLGSQRTTNKIIVLINFGTTYFKCIWEAELICWCRGALRLSGLHPFSTFSLWSVTECVGSSSGFIMHLHSSVNVAGRDIKHTCVVSKWLNISIMTSGYSGIQKCWNRTNFTITISNTKWQNPN